MLLQHYADEHSSLLWLVQAIESMQIIEIPVQYIKDLSILNIMKLNDGGIITKTKYGAVNDLDE